MMFHLTFLILGKLTKPIIEVVRVTENSVDGNVRLPGYNFLRYFRSITYTVSLTETAGMRKLCNFSVWFCLFCCLYVTCKKTRLSFRIDVILKKQRPVFNRFLYTRGGRSFRMGGHILKNVAVESGTLHYKVGKFIRCVNKYVLILNDSR